MRPAARASFVRQAGGGGDSEIPTEILGAFELLSLFPGLNKMKKFSIFGEAMQPGAPRMNAIKFTQEAARMGKLLSWRRIYCLHGDSTYLPELLKSGYARSPGGRESPCETLKGRTKTQTTVVECISHSRVARSGPRVPGTVRSCTTKVAQLRRASGASTDYFVLGRK